MKTSKTILFGLMCVALMFISTSCMVLLTEQHHGKHKGWEKNTNNPHHPKTTNPGHKKSKKKSYK